MESKIAAAVRAAIEATRRTESLWLQRHVAVALQPDCPPRRSNAR